MLPKVFIIIQINFKKFKKKEIEELKVKFLSLFESIIYYNVDQKQMYNKALFRVKNFYFSYLLNNKNLKLVNF